MSGMRRGMMIGGSRLDGVLTSYLRRLGRGRGGRRAALYYACIVSTNSTSWAVQDPQRWSLFEIWFRPGRK